MSAVRENILKLNLEETVAAFYGSKWKFYDVREMMIHVEVPRTERERYVVELTFETDEKIAAAVGDLRDAGFIPHAVKYAPL